MAAEKQAQRIVALDIGTNKIAAIVANVNAQGELEIIGIGTHQSRGLKKGVVVNIDSTVQSIQRAVEEAELMSGCEIDSVYAGIAGSHIRSLNSHGIVAIRDREVFALDIDRVIDAAKAMAGLPFLQQFVVVGKEETLMASGCVPTAAASVVSYWAKTKYPQWRGGDSKTRKDLALRLRGRLKMALFPDHDGFTENGMALAGAFPGDLLKALREDAAKYQVPMEIEIGGFSFPIFKREIDESRPVLLSCLVRVPHKPELSWGHEVAAVGYCEIDGVKLVGVQDNFFPTIAKETIRWIREDAFRSMITLRQRVE